MKPINCIMRTTFTLLLVLTCLQASIAQIGKEDLPDMNLAVFKSFMDNSLKDSVKGYAFYLTKDGNYVTSGAGGIARTAADNNGAALPHSITRLQEIASVSKMITAIAILRVIEKSPFVTVDSKIGPWLPKGWNPGKDFASITFKQLLSHRSGLRADAKLTGPGYENLAEQHAQKSIDPALQKVSSYLNLNFQILRICLPNILSSDQQKYDAKMTNLLKIGLMSRLQYNEFVAETGSAIYRKYVMNYLFLPAGITAPTCNPVGHPNLAWAYNTRGSSTGDEGVDHSTYCSSGFWQVSAQDLAVFITKTMHSEDIISNASKAIINNKFSLDTVGWSDKLKRGNGYSYGHGGDVTWLKGETHSYLLYLPGNYVAYVHTNSGEFGSGTLGSLLYQAYDAARRFPYNCYNNGATYQFPQASMNGHISKVKLGAINQTSGKGTGYTFYNNYTTPLKQDSSYTLKLTSAFSKKSDNIHWSVWIDYDQNGVFNANEKVF